MVQCPCPSHRHPRPDARLDALRRRYSAGLGAVWQRRDYRIGDAPTAVTEAVRLVEQQGWRPQLIVGLPVGFVGAAECKEALRNTIQVPRMTNRGTRGGSPWAATVIN